MTPMSNSVSLETTGSSSSSTLPVTANDAASADRFLKLLVAQMQNQDPMNPMDNAQMTSQMNPPCPSSCRCRRCRGRASSATT